MKTPAFILYASLLGLVAILFSGCASKSRPYSHQHTVVTSPDGTRTETTSIERDSKIKASGYKLDLAGFGVDETWQQGTGGNPGDASYRLNSEGAKATPQSQALEAFTGGLNAALMFKGIQPAQPGINPELQERLDKIDAGLADLEAIAEALKALESNPIPE